MKYSTRLIIAANISLLVASTFILPIIVLALAFLQLTLGTYYFFGGIVTACLFVAGFFFLGEALFNNDISAFDEGLTRINEKIAVLIAEERTK